MINTLNVQQAQRAHGFYSVGYGPEIILMVGSCRCVPYLTYFDYLAGTKRFTVCFIDPLNWLWDDTGKALDYKTQLEKVESDKRVLDLIKSAKWYIHEHYLNHGMFNSTKISPKNIFQFGMSPDINNVTIPNFSNQLILFQEAVTLDKTYNERAKLEFKLLGGNLCDAFQTIIRERGLKNVETFAESCRFSDFPEFGDLFRDTWKKVRYFATINHITNQFTIAIFKMLNDRFLHLDTPTSFWTRIATEDLYASPRIPVTQYDVANYGIQWPEPVQPLIP